jgi:hypothetical protein
MNEKTTRARMLLYIPIPLKEWLKQQAEQNYTSQNSEIVLALREKRERVHAEQPKAGV